MDPPFHSRVKLTVSWVDSSRWKPSKATKDTNVSRLLASIFCDVQVILFIDYLEKGRTINSEYYIALLVRLKEECQKTATNEEEKKCSFTKTMHRVISQSQWWQNYMYSISNCFCIEPILQIWPPVNTDCLQTSKECSKERNLAPMKKWYQKLRCILRPKINCSTKKASNC